MIPVSTLYSEYIGRPKLTEQKNPFEKKTLKRVGTIIEVYIFQNYQVSNWPLSESGFTSSRFQGLPTVFYLRQTFCDIFVLVLFFALSAQSFLKRQLLSKAI